MIDVRDESTAVAAPIRPEAKPAPASASEFGPVPVSSSTAVASGRLLSLDAYRGFVMVLMASAGLGLATLAESSESIPLGLVAAQTEHADWEGYTFWDLIQPSFMFIVGVAMPWAYANRKARGQGWWAQFGHTLVRATVLVFLGVFLASNGAKQTNWTFVNVLSQIGLGLPFVFLILGWRPAWQFAAALAILVGYWAFFAFWPLPGQGGAWPAVSTYDALPEHWMKRFNAASAFDVTFLNLLPRPDGKPFLANEGGYATLNFVPSIATAIFGVLVGRLLKADRPARGKLQILAVAGAVGVVLGVGLDGTVCPVIKRIWTPSWAIASGGWACLLMAAFYLAVDVWGWRKLAFPLVVVGANSIAIYLMAQLTKPWVRQTLRTHLATLRHVVEARLGWAGLPEIASGGGVFAGPYGPILDTTAVLACFWLACLWLYRRKIFIRI